MTTRQGRILLVDDDAEWLEVMSETLQRAGYYVATAATSNEAREKLFSSPFHLVILDIRMNADDPTNEEGIALLHILKRSTIDKGLKIIMLSAYNTLQRMRTAFKEEVVDVLDKQDFDNLVFAKEVQNVFKKSINIHLDLEIDWQQVSGPEKVILGLEIATPMGMERVGKNSPLLSTIADELEDLLCRLFSTAASILVRPLRAGNSGTNVLAVQPAYQDGAAHAVIVKYGDIQRIDAEYMKFKKYAEPYIGGSRNTTTLAVRHTLHLGGIIYSLLGGVNDRMRSFGDFYHDSSAEEIQAVIKDLFSMTCGAWYASPGKKYPLNLSKVYPQSLNFTWEKLYTALNESLKSVQGKEQLVFNALNDSTLKFVNPISATERSNIFYPTYTCITHGDFNQNNILIDTSGHSWLIDFQETEPGHILRDIVALDTEIRCKLLAPDDATLRERLALEQALCSFDHFHQLEQASTAFSTSNLHLAKVYEIIIYLRLLAYGLVPRNQDDSMTEYYTALLYNTLNTSRFRTIATTQREHALLSASLLVEKLNLKD